MYKEISKEDKAILELGDIVKATNSLGGVTHYKITRLSKKFAFGTSKHNNFENKFPINFSYGFQSYPKDTWNMTEYRLYKNIGE